MRVPMLCWLVLGLGLAGMPAAAQPPAKGMLLVATEQLDDPSFRETVVLLLHYDDNGALGLIINRPTWVEPATAFDIPAPLGSYDGHIYIGGPLGRPSLVTLLRYPEAAAAGDAEGTEPPGDRILAGVYMTTDENFLGEHPEIATSEARVRIYAGHAVWQPGQLEEELARGDWQVATGTADRVFSPAPLELWRRLAAQQGGELVAAAPGRR